jgi:Flp pilus assembly protein CpaB
VNPPNDDDRPVGPLGRLRGWFEGPPVVLPGLLDETAERWAAAGPRVRLAATLAAAAVLIGAATSSALSSPWGEPVPAVVAVRELPVGDVVRPDDVRVARLPEGVLPVEPVRDPDDVTGRTLTRSVPAGAVLTAGDVADGGPAAHLPDGLVAFPLPLSDTGVLSPGQRVDLVAGDGGGSGSRLASGALVLVVEDGSAWVAVQREEAPALAAAGRWGEVVPVLLPP